MTFGQKLAVHLAPLSLRLVLGTTFLWAGLGKLLVTIEYPPPTHAALAEMGVLDAEGLPAEDELLDEAVDDVTDAAGDMINDAGEAIEDATDDVTDQLDDTMGAIDTTSPIITLTQNADDVEPVKLRKLYGIALLMKSSGNLEPRMVQTGEPEGGPEGEATFITAEPRFQLLPSVLTDGKAPAYLAWMAAITEAAAGLFILVGLLTRLSGLALAGTMVTALWTTTIGPAIAYGTTWLFIIPLPLAQDGSAMMWHDPAAYATLGWQLALFAMGLAVFFGGSGALSVDRLLFGGAKPKRANADADD